MKQLRPITQFGDRVKCNVDLSESPDTCITKWCTEEAKKKNMCVYGPPTDPNFWPRP